MWKNQRNRNPRWECLATLLRPCSGQLLQELWPNSSSRAARRLIEGNLISITMYDYQVKERLKGNSNALSKFKLFVPQTKYFAISPSWQYWLEFKLYLRCIFADICWDFDLLSVCGKKHNMMILTSRWEEPEEPPCLSPPRPPGSPPRPALPREQVLHRS